VHRPIVRIDPVIATAAMALSSLSVIVNSALLKRQRLSMV
jgi:cation transport ATPase